MGYSIDHQVRFHETDAAGVMYFAQGLALCHNAYEDSLVAAGITLADFFCSRADHVFPIVHASMDYRRPMRCGEVVTIALQPKRLDSSSFEVAYCLHPQGQLAVLVAEAITRHVCIDPISRQRQPLPPLLEHWLECCSGEARSHPTPS